MEYDVEELLPIVAKLSEKYTENESTSITYEKAQQLMNAVLYCIKESDYEKHTALQKETVLAKEAYELGYQNVVKNVKRAMHLYNKIMENFLSYGNICLEDTIQKGMPEFFKWYDSCFNPQDTILTLDYPVLRNLSKYRGIDAVYRYLSCIYIEQIFLTHFDSNYIITALSHYNNDYKNMLENLTQIIYQFILCHIIIGKKINETQFSENEIKQLNQKIRNTETNDLKEHLNSFTDYFVEQFYDNHIALKKYLYLSISDITIYFKQMAENDNFIFND